ncbi:MAG TPA: hypothetical protein VKQ06_01300 [Gammaproteobacteria bacterium]|nr:hypothetical protein [Gammaproteobacteria bacterium]
MRAPQKLIVTAMLAAASLTAHRGHAQVFVDFGVHSSEIESRFANLDTPVSVSDSGVHIGLGARRAVTDRSDIGVRLELNSIDGNAFAAVRAVDFRRRFKQRFAVTAFLGAARLDLATPAWGYYVGFGVQWLELAAKWDLSIDAHFGEKVARDNLLPEDPQGGSPDNFHDVSGVSLYLSRSFGAAGDNR